MTRRAGMWPSSLVAIAMLAALLLGATRAPASDSVLESSSLQFVPANTAFYMSLQRNKQQYDALVNSNAFKQFITLPYMDMLITQMKQGFEQGVGANAAMLQTDEAKMAIGMLLDALSHEIFVYGDEGFAEMAGNMGQLQAIIQKAQFEQALGGQTDDEAIIGALMAGLDALPANMAIPDMVIGFKVSNPDAMKQMLAQLEEGGGMAAQQVPALAGKITRKQLGGGDYVVANLDGSMIPWDQARGEFPGTDEEWNKLVSKIKPLTLSIAIGVRDDFVILSTGDSDQHLADLGQGQKLADVAELKPLMEHADKQLTSVGYVSKNFASKANNVESQVNSMVNTVQQAMNFLPLPDDLKGEMMTDVKKLGSLMTEVVPEPGAQVSFSYMTDSGYQSYAYNYGGNPLDGTKPLTILEHVGGDPLMYVAARGKYRPESYDQIVHFMKRGLYYAETLGSNELDDEERELLAEIKKEFTPLLERLDKVNRDTLIPAFEDSQGALVLDGKTTSTAWHAFMPASPQPLAIPEIGFVYGVSDEAKVKEGFSEYFAVAQEVMTKLHKMSTGEHADLFPQPIPDVTIPEPKMKEQADGTVYYYALPADTMVDAKLSPNAGLSKDVMVMSLMPTFTSRLLSKTSLAVGEEIAKQGKPIAAASYCNFAGIIDMLLPWVDYAAMMSNPVSTQPDPQEVAAIIEQVKATAAILKCFQGGSSVTFKDGNAWVTRSTITFKDID